MKQDIILWLEKDNKNQLGKMRNLEIINLLNEKKIPFKKGIVDEELKKYVSTLSNPPTLQIQDRRGGSKWIEGYDRVKEHIPNFDYMNN